MRYAALCEKLRRVMLTQSGQKTLNLNKFAYISTLYKFWAAQADCVVIPIP